MSVLGMATRGLATAKVATMARATMARAAVRGVSQAEVGRGGGDTEYWSQRN